MQKINKFLKTQNSTHENTKVNNLKNKIPDGTTLIHTNQYKADKQSSEKEIGDVNKKSA